MEKIEEKEKFEFLLKIEDNIICQRFFTVKNHNPKTTHSMELYWSVEEIKDLIKKYLVLKTVYFLDEFYKEDMSKLQGQEENFTITINKGNHTLMERIFPANHFPPRIRYSVDIRPQISYILRELTDVLSDRKPTCYYLDKKL